MGVDVVVGGGSWCRWSGGRGELVSLDEDSKRQQSTKNDTPSVNTYTINNMN